MKRYNNDDWTDAVRRRLEGRELTPPESLWEGLGQALPEAGAARKVRRLAWGGAVGAAAAAALAAVLLLRPFGAPEDARVDIVPTPAAPLAEALKEEPVAVADSHSEINEGSGEQGSPAPLRMTKEDVLKEALRQADAMPQEGHVTTEEETYVVTKDVPAVTTAGQPAAADDNSHTERNAGTVSALNHSGQNKSSEEPAMTIEDLIAQDNALRRHRSFNAALFASGVPSVNFMLSKDYDEDIHHISYNYYPQGSLSDSSSPSDIGSSTGIRYDPEDPSGYIEYNNDPYNLAGGGRLNHSKPVSVGIALTYPLDKHLFLESGLYYSYLHSTSFQLKDQKLHSLGVPLKLGYRFGSAGRTSLALSAGAKAEKCILATRGGERFKEPGIQLAAVGSAAIQYDFSPYIGIFIAPELSYWFTETKLPTYNTENPLNLSLKAGLNLTVGR